MNYDKISEQEEAPVVRLPLQLLKFALSTTWTKYTKTFSVASISGKTLGTNGNDYLRLAFWLDAGSDYNSRTNTLGNQAGTFEFAQVQVEKGSSASVLKKKQKLPQN